MGAVQVGQEVTTEGRVQLELVVVALVSPHVGVQLAFEEGDVLAGELVVFLTEELLVQLCLVQLQIEQVHLEKPREDFLVLLEDLDENRACMLFVAQNLAL